MDIVKEYGGGLYSRDDNLIVISPSVKEAELTLTKEEIVRLGSPGIKYKVEENTTTTLFHEIGESNTPKSNTTRGQVTDFENNARTHLKMKERPYDLYHYWPIYNNNNKNE